jgi:O-antigen biosynthesis protein
MEIQTTILQDLYKALSGKVSDKWTLYLHEYDRILNTYKNQSIRLLEIGIQS